MKIGRSADAPRRARRFVTSVLSEWACDHLVEIAVLLTSELVSNAVMHTDGPILLCLSIHEDDLRIEVRDSEQRRPSRRTFDPEAPNGRGLLLVDELATAWGVRADPGGKAVWCTLDTRVAPGW